jgi:hypothetical protein
MDHLNEISVEELQDALANIDGRKSTLGDPPSRSSY